MTLSRRTDWIAAIVGVAWTIAALAIDKTSPHRFPEEANIEAVDIEALLVQCFVLLAIALEFRFAFKIWKWWCVWLFVWAIIGFLAQDNWYPPPIPGLILDGVLSALFFFYCKSRLKSPDLRKIIRTRWKVRLDP